MLASLTVGAAQIDLRAVFRNPQAMLVLLESRPSRRMAVALPGAALSVAGVPIQARDRDRFVAPETSGTAEGAALGPPAITILWSSSPCGCT